MGDCWQKQMSRQRGPIAQQWCDISICIFKCWVQHKLFLPLSTPTTAAVIVLIYVTAAGIRCIQAPLCYPNERRHRVKSIILQRTPHARDSSSSSSSGQQQQVQSMEAQDHHVANVPWLPVRVYQAHYRAQLVAAAADEQSNSSSSSVSRTSGASILQQFGLPVLHARKLQHSLTDQQQLDAAAVNGSSGSRCSSTGSSSSTSGNGLYTITNWQSSWCSNLFGVWSEYYKVTPREPHNTELAPWVAKRYKKYPRLAQRLAANSK